MKISNPCSLKIRGFTASLASNIPSLTVVELKKVS